MRRLAVLLLCASWLGSLPALFAQAARPDARLRAVSKPKAPVAAAREGLAGLAETPAVPGYESGLAGIIADRLRPLHPTVDRMSNVVVTIGSGAPRRVLVAPMDEPGFVVSGITQQGYLRLQRLPQQFSAPLFNELHSAQPVRVQTTTGKWIDGAVAGLSIHLQPGRQHAPDLADIDNMYVDVGAASAAEVHVAGVDRLSPVALDRTLYSMGFGKFSGAAVGDRFGDGALIEILKKVDRTKVRGTLIVAFVAQQYAGARGLQRLLQATKPDELIYIGRLTRSVAAAGASTTPTVEPKREPGSGVLIAVSGASAELSPLGTDLRQLAEQNSIPLATDTSSPPIPRPAYGTPAPMPARSVHLGIAVAWPNTPAETIDASDYQNLVALLSAYLQIPFSKTKVSAAAPLASPNLPARPNATPLPTTILRELVEHYGVSGGHERPVRETIAALLPAWAKPQTDDAGNLILHWGTANGAARVLVVAHQDEIGWDVKSVLPDGHLELQSEGGGVLAFFAGHPILVHTAAGIRPGVLELPSGWNQPGFQWPRTTARMTFRADVGAANPQQVAELGIKVGDFVTVPKRYRPLLGRRASARSFDDRVGCAALVSAAWALGPNLKNREVTFVWSTGEELGLLGAASIAKRLAGDGRAPEFVFAVDTFVSSDSPLESDRFANAELGKGFVVRAVDTSNIVPAGDVSRLVALAHSAGIPVQYGVTGGGNDGSAFLVYGSTDVAIGWPLRYAHSPGEVIDTRDLEGLAQIVAAVSRAW